MISVRDLIVLFIGMCLSTNILGQSGEKMYLHEDQQGEDAPCMYVNIAKDSKTRAAVLVIPGGGYQGLAIGHEGEDIVQWFLKRGVHAIMLKYSLGLFDGTGHKHPDMINDAKRAMRIIRHNADKWDINPDAITVMGFSAGGHLTSTLATHADNGNPEAADPIERQSCIPNLCVLSYPVIMMDGKYTHWGSRRFLLGPSPAMDDVRSLSNNDHVSVITPPTILFHTSDDNVVPVENSINFYLALRAHGIPCEMHIFEHGAHGLGLIIDDFALKQWEPLLENWLMRWGVFVKK